MFWNHVASHILGMSQINARLKPVALANFLMNMRGIRFPLHSSRHQVEDTELLEHGFKWATSKADQGQPAVGISRHRCVACAAHCWRALGCGSKMQPEPRTEMN